MAKEYIEREAVKRELLSWAACMNHPKHLMRDDALHVIDSIPAADVAEVLRCRNCKYWGDEAGKLQRSDGVLFARCKVHNYLIDGRHTGWCPTENDFCSYGERKGGDGNAQE